MVTPQELKAALLSRLGSRIGTYRFSGGQTTPAIRVDDGSDAYPEEPDCTGLEVVIVPSIDIAIQPMLGGYRDTVTTAIFLKQWDIAETTDALRTPLLEAVNQFADLLIVPGSMRRQLRQTRLDNIEILTVQFSQSVLAMDAE